MCLYGEIVNEIWSIHTGKVLLTVDGTLALWITLPDQSKNLEGYTGVKSRWYLF